MSGAKLVKIELGVAGKFMFEPGATVSIAGQLYTIDGTAESAHLKPYDGVKQDDGWDADCDDSSRYGAGTGFLGT